MNLAASGEPDLGVDRPTAAELLEIIAATLTETVVPATATHAQHQARVAANLCRILQRELEAPPAPPVTLPDSLITCSDSDAAAAFDDVLALVQSKLAVAKPGYDTHDAQAEANVIA